jgi:hypothetical protein
MLGRRRRTVYFSGLNRPPTEKRAQILQMMVEDVSIRAIARMTNGSKNTIVKLLTARLVRRALRAPQGAPQPTLQADPGRRGLRFPVRQTKTKERPAGEASHFWLRRRMDLDCH